MWLAHRAGAESEKMTVIVSGGGVGFLNSSLNLPGQPGLPGAAIQGRKQEVSIVNIATGNLALQNRDEYVASLGLDLALARTYNSQGSLNDGIGMLWKVGLLKKVTGPSGTLNTAGSSVTRIETDGSAYTYAWDATRAAYVGTEGEGAYRTIVKSGTQWIWRDERGDSAGLYEVYDATMSGRILTAGDQNGVSLTYFYNTAGAVSHIVNATGDTTYFDYGGNGSILKHRVVPAGATQATLSISYTYDGYSRLTLVTTDLTPADGLIADGKVHTTAYTYGEANYRVTSVTHSDGRRLAFAYENFGGVWKISSVTEGNDAPTTFSYGYNKTTVYGADGNTAIYAYDTAGNLVSALRYGTGAIETSSFVYDARGTVTKITDAAGVVTRYEYDAKGTRCAGRCQACARLFGQRQPLAGRDPLCGRRRRPGGTSAGHQLCVRQQQPPALRD